MQVAEHPELGFGHAVRPPGERRARQAVAVCVLVRVGVRVPETPVVGDVIRGHAVAVNPASVIG